MGMLLNQQQQQQKMTIKSEDFRCLFKSLKFYFVVESFSNIFILRGGCLEKGGCRQLSGTAGQGQGRFVGFIAVLRLVEILPHDRVERFAPEAKDLAEGQPEVLVGGGVDDGVEETVGVAQPEEERRQPARDDQRGRLVAHERTDQGQHEKREPAQREGAHDDPQRRRRLSHSSPQKIKRKLTEIPPDE
jgi:hypothetical protein